ncbi:hypothetical protein Y032_0014g2267 [Ancylostoma ceylanicum]|uniref:DUF7622 domain-containing protein n=1 Tax=Ancylostoma ceylanicum TaxID=53326 RepID=A0A016VAI0_9BILA|nr:hypothetical protein Y032_0014g2267 [Ancylostoma ceylanicum]
MSELLVLLAALVAVTHALECYQCESEYGGVKCEAPCTGEVCVVWKWRTRSELLVKQGCVSGVDPQFTAKIGCRTNYLGASMCLCNDGDLCNNVERTENTIRPLPIVQLPVVECTRKVTGTGIFGSPREHVCSSNYCHMTRTESYSEDFPPDVLTVYNCGDISEFDFDLRLKNTIDFPGLYANGCYRIQYQPKESVTDCICSRNQCNTALPVVQSGPVRCYISHGAKNESVVDTNHFCDGDYCFVQKHNGKYTKGCLSVNERNSWSHLKSGHRHILGVDQWLCQHHLCNFDLNRVARAIAPSHKSIYRLNVTSNRFPLTVIVLMFSVYVREFCFDSQY